MNKEFSQRLAAMEQQQEGILSRKNKPLPTENGIYQRYQYPVLTAAHAPLHWQYDMNEETNPRLLQRFGINAVLNAGAIYWKGKYLLAARVEGADRKSFFCDSRESERC